jgi:hypothetical protein
MIRALHRAGTGTWNPVLRKHVLSGHVENLTGGTSHIWGVVSEDLHGDASGVTGDISGLTGTFMYGFGGDVSRISGDISGKHGNCSLVYGDVSNLMIDFDDAFCAAPNPGGLVIPLSGDMTNISGNASAGFGGEVSSGLSGDITGITGCATGIIGNIDDCGLTAGDRDDGVDIFDLVVV